MTEQHPFHVGQLIICVRAPEAGIPVREGETYTALSVFFGNQQRHEACIEGMEQTPGVTLAEVEGYFTADRFEPDDAHDLRQQALDIASVT